MVIVTPNETSIPGIYSNKKKIIFFHVFFHLKIIKITKERISKTSFSKNLPTPLFAILRQAQDDKCHGEPVEPFPPFGKGKLGEIL